MSDLVLQAISDGDRMTFMESIAFSTSPREVVTVGDMEMYYYLCEVRGIVTENIK